MIPVMNFDGLHVSIKLAPSRSTLDGLTHDMRFYDVSLKASDGGKERVFPSEAKIANVARKYLGPHFIALREVMEDWFEIVLKPGASEEERAVFLAAVCVHTKIPRRRK